jgi:hypothetical protein
VKLIISLLVLGAVVAYAASSDEQVTALQKRARAINCTFTNDVSELIDWAEKNEITFDESVHAKVCLIRGVVRKIGSDDGSPYAELIDRRLEVHELEGKIAPAITCYFPVSDKTQVADRFSGERVLVQGFCFRNRGRLLVIGAILVSPVKQVSK